ncbi:hypothetical protein CURTO8I2_280016 [Curtobacterium sp. 8I-2]|nr:hypothetical protein CURTO8I2_280016 [Curtobacterium sp. 8I-2]
MDPARTAGRCRAEARHRFGQRPGLRARPPRHRRLEHPAARLTRWWGVRCSRKRQTRGTRCGPVREGDRLQRLFRSDLSLSQSALVVTTDGREARGGPATGLPSVVRARSFPCHARWQAESGIPGRKE